jgi:hypothetical protein
MSAFPAAQSASGVRVDDTQAPIRSGFSPLPEPNPQRSGCQHRSQHRWITMLRDSLRNQ